MAGGLQYQRFVLTGRINRFGEPETVAQWTECTLAMARLMLRNNLSEQLRGPNGETVTLKVVNAIEAKELAAEQVRQSQDRYARAANVHVSRSRAIGRVV